MVHPIHIKTDTKGVGHYALKTIVSDGEYRPILIIFPWAKEIVVNKDYGFKVRQEPKEYFGEGSE